MAKQQKKKSTPKKSGTGADARIAAAGEAIADAAQKQGESEAAQAELKQHSPEELAAAEAQRVADELAAKLPDAE